MITGFGLICLNVGDLDEAKEFYVGLLGFEVGFDEVMDGFRWLTVYAPGNPDMPMMLVVPEPPAVEASISEQMHSLMARGYLGLGGLATDNCRATYEELKAKGVEFIEEPQERFYGVDAAFRDPFGNHWRLTEAKTLDQIRDDVDSAG